MATTREHPALHMYRRLLGSHPRTHLPEFGTGYLPPDSILAESCPRRKGYYKANPEGHTMRAILPSTRSLYNHVDPVSCYRALDPEKLASFIELTKASLRMVTPESFPKTIPAFIYFDRNHGKTVLNRYEDGMAEEVFQVGTPIADLGGGDARKLMVTWRGKDIVDNRMTYTGPPAQVIDKRPRMPHCLFPEVGEEDGERPPTISNIFYRQYDIEEGGVSVVPMSSVLTSINVLTQLNAGVVSEILDRDGFHMVPNLEKLLADKMADELPDGRVITRVYGKDGAIEEYIDYNHGLNGIIHKCVHNVDHYKLVVAFSPRTLHVSGPKWTMMRERYEQPLLDEKPFRYGFHKDVALLPPFKLKWDGETILFDFSEERAMIHGINYETELVTDEDYQCFVRVQVVCESIVVGQVNHIFPFAVYLAGRKLVGTAVLDFMQRTSIQIPGFEFHPPEFYDTQDEAVVAMATARYQDMGLVADGIVALGTGDEVVAKIYETIDIKPCDPKSNLQMARAVAPKLLQYAGATDPEMYCTCEDVDSRMASSHEDCPVVEFFVMYEGLTVELVQKTIRTDKEKPNSMKRVLRMLPKPLDEHEHPPEKLVDNLSDDTKTVLRQYGYRV